MVRFRIHFEDKVDWLCLWIPCGHKRMVVQVIAAKSAGDEGKVRGDDVREVSGERAQTICRFLQTMGRNLLSLMGAPGGF